MIHYEEALYQVYAPLPFTFTCNKYVPVSHTCLDVLNTFNILFVSVTR